MTKTKKSPIIISAIIFVCLVLSGALLGWCLAETKNIINSEYITEFDIALPTKLLHIKNCHNT